ncbi:hypothetical protein [Chishuiella changwenlii]|uniref:hypothetical protein n=1 Tax=Chishuiella changwenlii TaxID=1434701 RepID=UPI002FDB8C71
MKILHLTILLFFALTSCIYSQQVNKQNIDNAITKNATKLLEDKRFHSVSIAVLKDGESTTKHFGELTIGKKINQTILHFMN